jgi:5,10-methenyltetrahydrofolate synthetase
MDSMSPSRPALRRELLGARSQMQEAERTRADALIRAALLLKIETALGARAGDAVIASYWPIQGEPDLRPLWNRWREIALPVVVGPAHPLRFARWRPGMAMSVGPHRVPAPAHPEWLEPDLLIIPCLGFHVDARGKCFRLGYGGGYYDRTLQAHDRPTVGVAYAAGRLSEFKPEVHDVPLDTIVTQTGTW